MPQPQTASLIEARKLVALRAILGMPNHGVFGQLTSGEIIPHDQFTEPPPAILLIKVVDRPEREDSPSIRESDDFINVGATLDNLRRAPHVDSAIKRMIAVENVGIQDSEIMSRLMNLSGVQSAYRTAVAKAIGDL